MKINFASQNFKGYDAAPIKTIRINESILCEFKEELDEIAKQENFEIKSKRDGVKWVQDHKTVIEHNGAPALLLSKKALERIPDINKLEYPYKKCINFIAGGNSFIGKFPDGEKWMMAGSSDVDCRLKYFVGKDYGIKPENIFIIPQQNFHLDMFLRPVEYPYVLVDSPKLTREKLLEIKSEKPGKESEDLYWNFARHERKRNLMYAEHKKVIDALKKNGFIPIEIAGVYSSGVNFMNALVNKHEDGSLSYITNSSRCDDELTSKLQEKFEQDLRAKVPNIDKVLFVSGNQVNERSNFLMYQLGTYNGGLHCMASEEPDFEMWG